MRIYRESLKRGKSIVGLDSDEEIEERAKILKSEGNEEGAQTYGNLGALWGLHA